jgi:hypothetical protein
MNAPAGFFGIAVFLGTARYEERAATYPGYRRFRTFTRVLLAPVGFDTLIIPLLLIFVSWRVAFDWTLLSGVRGLKIVRIAAEMAAFYLFLCWRATRDHDRAARDAGEAVALARLRDVSVAAPRPPRQPPA